MSSSKHEDFEVNTSGSKQGKRLKLVRQDRIKVEGVEAFIEVDDKKYNVINFSSFGLAVESPIQWQTDEFHGLPFIYNGVEVAQVHAKITRQHPVGEAYEVAFEILGEPICLQKIKAVQSCAEILEVHSKTFETFNEIPEAFRMIVYQAKDWMERLQSRVDALEPSLSRSNSQDRLSFESTVIPIIGSYIGEVFPQQYHALADQMKGLDEESIKHCVSFFRQTLKETLIRTPFSERVYNKPLGYAGDYEMMNIIYRSESLDPSLFLRALEYYWLNEPAAQAVKNRANYLMEKIVQHIGQKRGGKVSRILSVACGPAMEWQRIISELPDCRDVEMVIDLLDQDQEALKHAQHEMRKLSNRHQNSFQFRYLNLAIKNVITRGLDQEPYDLIYSAGLFDYLSAPVAQVTAQKLYSVLKPGGSLIVGNFSIANPCAAVMDLGLDWNLIYRSDNDMEKLFEHLGGRVSLEKEPLGINLFCKIEKPSDN